MIEPFKPMPGTVQVCANVQVTGGMSLVEAPLRNVYEHTVLDIFPGGPALVVCVKCRATWPEGGFPPKDCAL